MAQTQAPAPQQKPAATPAVQKEPAKPDPVVKKQAPPVAEAKKEEPPKVAATATEPTEPAEEMVEETHLPTDYEAFEDPNAGSGYYKVRSKAYFHNRPDESTRRDAFIVHWNNTMLTPLEERDGFIYIVFTNHEGQTSRGWLRKKDLVELKVKELKK